MKTLALFLFMCLAMVCAAAEPAPETKPLFPAAVTCFNGKIDLSSSGTVSVGSVAEGSWSTGMTCGSPGQVSELHWEFLGSEGGADIYQFTRRFPADAEPSETVTKKIKFAGKRLTIFEDSYQVVVIGPPKPYKVKTK